MAVPPRDPEATMVFRAWISLTSEQAGQVADAWNEYIKLSPAEQRRARTLVNERVLKVALGPYGSVCRFCGK